MPQLLLKIHSESGRLQQSSLERWVGRQLGGTEHERRVAQTALKVFDLTWPLHGLSRSSRHLLRLAAIVHDVGRSIDNRTHPEQGAMMLLEEERLPLSTAERRCLAYLTRYHRGCVPDLGEDEFLHRSDDRAGLRTLLGMLRSADSLDGRSLESPQLFFRLTGRKLQIECLLEGHSPKARRVYARHKKHRLLEEVLNCRIDVRVAERRAMKLAA